MRVKTLADLRNNYGNRFVEETEYILEAQRGLDDAEHTRNILISSAGFTIMVFAFYLLFKLVLE